MNRIEDTPNYSYLMEISKGDQNFVLEIIQLFITKMPLNIDELENAINVKNWEDVSFCLHKLKSPLKILGIDLIIDLVESLERKELGEMKEKELKEFYLVFSEIKTEINKYLEDFKRIIHN